MALGFYAFVFNFFFPKESEVSSCQMKCHCAICQLFFFFSDLFTESLESYSSCPFVSCELHSWWEISTNSL